MKRLVDMKRPAIRGVNEGIFLFNSPRLPRYVSAKECALKPNRAFTLIELLVVIIIIAVMGAVVTPRYARYLEKVRFEGQVREVVDLFAYAREKAVDTDSVVTLSFDREITTFRVKGNAPQPSADLPEALKNATQSSPDTGTQIDAGLQLSELYEVANFQIGNAAQRNAGDRRNGSPEVRFRGDGTVEEAQVVLIAKTGDIATLELSPATGRLTRIESEIVTQP